MSVSDDEMLLFSGQPPETDDRSVSVSEPDSVAASLDAFVRGRFDQVLTGAAAGLLAGNVSRSPASSEDLLMERATAFVRGGQDVEEQRARQFAVLLLGASSLQLFVQSNWTGPSTRPFSIPLLAGAKPDEITALLSEGEEPVFATLNGAEFLWLAKIFLRSCGHLLDRCPTAAWWRIRYVYIHQQVLDERSPGLFAVAEEALETTFADSKIEDKTVMVLLYLEAFHVCLLYYKQTKAAEFLNEAQKAVGLSLSLTGILGKRTQFQQRDIAQLSLKVERESSEEPAKGEEKVGISSRTSIDFLPKDLRLNDEVRLETVKFKEGEELSIPALSSIDQAVILGYFTHVQKTNAVHRLVNEELMTYLRILLSNPLNWAIQSAALLQRSIIESDQSRSVERSMMQIQELFDQFCQYENTPPGFRLGLIYSTAYPPRCILEKELARLFRQMGAINSALEVYTRLQDWENVISCYHILQRRDKAEAVVRQQLSVKETPVLWCYLGDATDDPQWYLKAWEMSGHRSARAQKSLGMLHFRRKEYESSIPYLEKSVEINGIQLDTWFSLAYAALQVENWELTAKAYRRCINLEPDNFEAWNNLSNAYVKLNQKTRAWRTLQEALKCNYEDWKIWENYILVSVDCGAFSEVIKAYHRILDLKDKHLDVEILGILVKAVTEGIMDNEGKPASTLFQKLSQLFGRLTAMVTTNGPLWRLYGKLISSKNELTDEASHKVAQYYQKSHRSFTQIRGWEKDPASCRDVLEVSLDLANAQMQMYEKVPAAVSGQHLSSAKLTLNSTISTVKQYEGSSGVPLAPEVVSALESLGEKLGEIVEKLNSPSTNG